MKLVCNLLKCFCLLILFSSTLTTSVNAQVVPDHVVVLILENHAYTQIIGSTAAPYINALANDPNSAWFTQSYAIEHPSQPNYLDFYSGCNQGITTDNLPTGTPYTTPNLGRQLLDAGKTFVTYSEGLPSVGYNGASSGTYARKHNPAANWMGTGTNQIPVTTNQPFTAFPSSNFSSLPTVCYVVPNMANDMHNGSDPARISLGDTWTSTNLDAYIQWAKTHNSLFILTFDEDDDNHGNRIVTIFNGPAVLGGQYMESISHYSVLRTIEDLYGLPHACNAATATSITDCWLASGISDEVSDNLFSVYPNPSNGDFTFKANNPALGKIENVVMFNSLGEKVFENSLSESSAVEFHLKNIPPGIYFIRGNIGNRMVTSKVTIHS